MRRTPENQKIREEDAREQETRMHGEVVKPEIKIPLVRQAFNTKSLTTHFGPIGPERICEI